MSLTPIYDFLIDYQKSGTARFHMPGHKGKSDDFNSVFKEVSQLDITEISRADSLYDCTGIIAQCEQNYKSLYQSEATLLSCGGSTLCIQTMLALVARPGGRVVCDRKLHRSAVHAMALLGLEPIWVYPVADQSDRLSQRVMPEQILETLSQHQDVAAVYLTSPDYYGVMYDIASIAQVCHQKGIPLLVDNAHGAHLKFCKEDRHPIALGADMCCDSAHKTLPVLTGGALLHIGASEYVDKAKRMMSVFGSTSPSYLIMASLDLCVPYLVTAAHQDFTALEECIDKLKVRVREKGAAVPDGICDRTRLTFSSYGIGKNGQVAQLMRACKLEPEYIGEHELVFLCSPQNSLKDFEMLEQFIDALPENIHDESFPLFLPFLEREMTLRQAFLSNTEMVATKNAQGRICADVCCPCPPAMPICLYGEKINKNIVKTLLNYGVFSVKVVK